MNKNFFCSVCWSYSSAAGGIKTAPYSVLKEERALWKNLEKAPPRWLNIWSHVFGIVCLIFGYAPIGMIIFWVMVSQVS